MFACGAPSTKPGAHETCRQILECQGGVLQLLAEQVAVEHVIGDLKVWRRVLDLHLDAGEQCLHPG